MLPYGGGADLVAVHQESVFPLPDNLSFEQGAALPMNYLTAEFALVTRGGVRSGDTVLVNGAAGGVGTASIQVAKGLGARVIAVVSTEEKAEVARSAGADEAVLVEGFRDAVKELTGGVGVDVARRRGRRRPDDRLAAVAGAAGPGPRRRLHRGDPSPQVKVNRLLLNNVDVRGVGWGAYAMVRPGFMRGQWTALLPMMQSGVVDPPIGKVYPLEQVGEALADMDARRTLGKSVVTF